MIKHFKTFEEFLKSNLAGGIILLSCVIVSLIIANTQFGVLFQHILDTHIGFENERVQLRYSVLTWINDGLMAIFFLMVGLEIKRELVDGELSSFKKATLPILAALGGVIVPATIYSLMNAGTSMSNGWGIPMATDIAFALAVVVMLGKKIPVSLKIFLTALAIVDDLCAILVIALFYTSQFHLSYLCLGLGIFVLMLLFNKLGIKNLFFYIIPGIVMWYFVHHSGVHATFAGVLTAFAIPTTDVDREGSPLESLEHLLVKPVNFIIMPIFALANTNIKFEKGIIDGIFSPLGMGIIIGLFIGKPLGICLFSWISVKLKISQLPDGVGWMHIVGAGVLAGIGFTMSVFIAILSFKDHAVLSDAKFFILIASIISGVVGSILLSRYNRKIQSLR